ncbi:hypothetical protein RJ639_040569 [Escallonia herrerae]|uniref:Uncharacterized protein n=1 Tax=Escallonia herrerae TaxID=1293975 RepID=A0AA88WFK6_9ASTE|nr:hypothetical protein RJ639_040569 [Escallonia herrerae]
MRRWKQSSCEIDTSTTGRFSVLTEFIKIRYSSVLGLGFKLLSEDGDGQTAASDCGTTNN